MDLHLETSVLLLDARFETLLVLGLFSACYGWAVLLLIVALRRRHGRVVQRGAYPVTRDAVRRRTARLARVPS